MQEVVAKSLHNAVLTGSLERVTILLKAGFDPDLPDERGNTALHEACKHGYTDIAALLLTHGADYTIRNLDRQAALSPDLIGVDTIHRIRQEYHRFSVSPYNKRPVDQQIKKYVDQLDQDGLIKVGGLLTSEQLSILQKDFRKFINRAIIERFVKQKKFNHYDKKEYWQPKHKAYVTNDAFLYSNELMQLCLNPVLTETANYYLGKPSYIKRAYAMRYFAFRPISINQFGWHHDMEEKQMKALVLLTNINEHDQYMEYVKGTHMIFHPYNNFFKNKLDFEYYENKINSIEIMRTMGEAGDVFLFDSNGMHRGIRSRGSVRDAFFIEYTSSKNKDNIWGSESTGKIAQNEKNNLTSPLYPLLNVIPKWIRTKNQAPRKYPSWIESLDDPHLWI